MRLNSLLGLINKLKSGEFDIVEPYSLQVRVGRKDKEDEEPVKEDKFKFRPTETDAPGMQARPDGYLKEDSVDFIHMMKVRAGIIK